MAGNVKSSQIEDLIESGLMLINDGYRAKNAELAPTGIPFARVGNINNGFHFKDADCFPTENLDRVGFKICQPGDVVFTSKGTVGRFAFVRPSTQRFVYSPQLCFWRSLDHNRIDPRWLYYWMQSREFYLQYKGVSSQTDMAEYVSLRDQRKMHITVTPFSEQKAIAHILGTLDDKIELNRRMNETLEAMARAVFKSWFVDFDPVRAKMDGRRPFGMDDATAALFPDGFEDSELGRVPKGWKVGCVKDEFRLTMGQSPLGSTYNEDGEGLPFFQGRRDFGFRFPKRRVFCSEPKRIANSGDTLVSVRAPVGDLNMAIEKCCVGRGVAAVRHKNSSRSFTYCSMHNLSEDFFRYEAEGTVFGSINKKNFESIKIVRHHSQLIDLFERQVWPIDQKIENLSRQIDTLSTFRDTLLPKLLTGEISVADAEKITEAA